MSQTNLFSPQPAPLADICRRKHKGNERSEVANQSVHSAKKSVREAIYDLLAASAGLTSKEIAAKLGKPLNTISGRLSELVHVEKRVLVTDEVRSGAAVLRVGK